ncbi:sugar transporter [Penicillium malachiteum]|nr:sugar transporter [Penicillium malachiteum]
MATRYASSSYGASIAATIATFLFNIFYPIGFLGGHFLYCTEVAPVRLRVAMTSLSTANHWLWNFIITMITPVALANVGWKYYIVFCCTTACVPKLHPFDIVPMAARLPVDDGQAAQYEPDKKPGIEIEQDEHMEFA